MTSINLQVSLFVICGNDYLLRLPDVLELQELSLNLLSKLVMSLILENMLLSLNIFRRP